MNLQLITDRFKTLRCYYKNNIPEGITRRSPDVTASYYSGENFIVFWHSQSIEEVDCRDVFHEIGHTLEITSPGKMHEYANVIW